MLANPTNRIEATFPGARRGAILVIIPAYNEQASIRQVVLAARRTLPQADVLVIDDGSADDTALQAGLAGAFVLRHPFNLGIGGAVQTGLKFARRRQYDYVVRIDGDGQHGAQFMPALLHEVQASGADVVIGSRFAGDGAGMHISLARRLGIALFRSEVTWLTGERVTDTTSGMLAMNRRAAEVLSRYIPQDYPEVEGRVIMRCLGLTTREIPVRMRERIAGTSSIDEWRSLYYAVKVSIAVLLTGLKPYPRVRQPEMPNAQPALPGTHP